MTDPTTPPAILADFWPPPEAVTATAPLRAEARTDALLVAVHVPVGAPPGAGASHLARRLTPPAPPATSGATACPDEIEAEELVLAHVRAALRRRALAARAECDAAAAREADPDPDLRAVAETHGPGLVALLDGPTRDAVFQAAPPLRALVARVASGAGAVGEFAPAHFEFAALPSNKITDPKAQRYVQKLKTNTQNERAVAAGLMNEAAATAAARLFAPPPQAPAPPEVIALGPWTVEDGIELIGTSLNAARVGAARLEEWYASCGRDPGAEPPSFEPRAAELSETDRAVLESHGRSARGYSLYPFSRPALVWLLEALPSRTPGAIIEDVLHAALVYGRIPLPAEPAPEPPAPEPVIEEPTPVEPEVPPEVPVLEAPPPRDAEPEPAPGEPEPPEPEAPSPAAEPAPPAPPEPEAPPPGPEPEPPAPVEPQELPALPAPEPPLPELPPASDNDATGAVP